MSGTKPTIPRQTGMPPSRAFDPTLDRHCHCIERTSGRIRKLLGFATGARCRTCRGPWQQRKAVARRLRGGRGLVARRHAEPADDAGGSPRAPLHSPFHCGDRLCGWVHRSCLFLALLHQARGPVSPMFSPAARIETTRLITDIARCNRPCVGRHSRSNIGPAMPRKSGVRHDGRHASTQQKAP